MAKGDLQKRIENAQRSLDKWPEWMKHAGQFTGSDAAPLPDTAEDHEIESGEVSDG